MNRARVALLLAVTACSASLLSAPAAAQSVSPISPPDHGLVIVALLDRASFEQAMAVPELTALARSGGVALMSTKGGSGDRTRAAYLTLAAGARAPSGQEQAYLPDVLRGSGVTDCLLEEASVEGVTDTRPSLLFAGGPLGKPRCELGAMDLRSAVEAVGREDAVLVIDTSGGERLPQSLGLQGVARGLAEAVVDSAAERVMIIVVAPQPSIQMDEVGDEVTPILVAEGAASELFPPIGTTHPLTSDSTRVRGLVSNVDVAPTILRFFGIPIPSEMEGNPIRVTDGAAPISLHRLHLEQRRIRIPLQVAEAVFVALAGLIVTGALAALRLGKKLSPGALEALRFLMLCAVALYVADLAGGLLPRMTYAVVVPFVVLATIGLAWAALAAGWPGPFGPFAFLAAAGLSFAVVDAALFGGRAFRLPLIGGTILDGARFYGLPNAFIALLLAGSIISSVRIEPFAGFVLIFAVGLFAGFPGLGANVGASITLFAGAGLWWVLRTRGRLRLKEVAFVGGVVAMGLAAVLLANRYLPGSPTHATRFVKRSASGLSTAVSTLRHRVGTAFHLLNAQPEGYVPMLALVVVLWLLIARPEPFRMGLEIAGEPWRCALLALVLASLVGFVANDTGTAAAAPGLVFAATGLACPVLALEAMRE